MPQHRSTCQRKSILKLTLIGVRPANPLMATRKLRDNETMSGIQFVTDEKGRRVGVLIDLKKHGAIWEDFWDGLVSESRRKEKGIPYEQYRATRLKRTRPRG
jgi:hypothetical protein